MVERQPDFDSFLSFDKNKISRNTLESRKKEKNEMDNAFNENQKAYEIYK